MSNGALQIGSRTVVELTGITRPYYAVVVSRLKDSRMYIGTEANSPRVVVFHEAEIMKIVGQLHSLSPFPCTICGKPIFFTRDAKPLLYLDVHLAGCAAEVDCVGLAHLCWDCYDVLRNKGMARITKELEDKT